MKQTEPTKSIESNFKQALIKLGFKTELEQQAAIKILYFGAYLKLDQVWHDLYILKITDVENKFRQAAEVLTQAKANQDNFNQFNSNFVVENLFKDLTVQDGMDFILYQTQHAFNRQKNQERNELTKQSWMEKYEVDYIQVVRELGLIDAITPDLDKYDATWIFSASRIGMLARLIYFEHYIYQKGVKPGVISILAGNREIWADIDGINPAILEKLNEIHTKKLNIDQSDIKLSVDEDLAKVEEGKNYIVDLAQKNNIKLQSGANIIKYEKKEECPTNRFINRFYPNYNDSANEKLTESTIANDLLKMYFSDTEYHTNIIDTQEQYNTRPTTSTTARDVTQRMIQEIKSQGEAKSEYHILAVSNNPYIERQTLDAQRNVNNVLKEQDISYKVTLHGMGFSCKQDVATVHSEFGIFVSERYKKAYIDDDSLNYDARNIKDLMFQTRQDREKDIIVPEMPDVKYLGESLSEVDITD